jgi:Protein of unknown function (DUF3303)
MVMKMMLTFSWSPRPHNRDAAIDRFMLKGGDVPAGCKLLGRWTRADASGGFALIESDDAKALTEFALAWHDMMALEMVPVLDDSDLGEVFRRLVKP